MLSSPISMTTPSVREAELKIDALGAQPEFLQTKEESGMKITTR